MDGKTHRIVGAVAGVGTTIACRHFERRDLRLFEVVGAGFGGVLGGMLPDVLEPATSSYHRQFAHSAAATGGLICAAAKTLGNVRNRLDAKADELYARAQASDNWLERILLYLGSFLLDGLTGFLTGLAGGYVSHVALDSMTPRGIPLLGVLPSC